MGYILDLRKQVGHRPLISVGSATLVTNSQGEWLLVKRNDNHQWGLPAGSMELSETLEFTAQRELREETGLIATDLHLKSLVSGEAMHYVYPNNDEIYAVTALYQTTHFQGQLKKQTNETEMARWFAPDQLPTALTPISAYLLSHLSQSTTGVDLLD